MAWITIEEAMKLGGLDNQQVHNAIKHRKFRSRQLPRLRKIQEIHLGSFKTWLEARKQSQPTPKRRSGEHAGPHHPWRTRQSDPSAL